MGAFIVLVILVVLLMAVLSVPFTRKRVRGRRIRQRAAIANHIARGMGNVPRVTWRYCPRCFAKLTAEEAKPHLLYKREEILGLWERTPHTLCPYCASLSLARALIIEEFVDIAAIGRLADRIAVLEEAKKPSGKRR